MHIFSSDGQWVLGCVERGIEILFTRPIPAWAINA